MQREIAHNLETGERRTTDVAPGKVKTFPELNLRHEILRALQRRNFLTPTMIQAAAIPMALSKKDLLVQSKSGTGKTLIYVIAALQGFDASIKTPQALVVVPTRELAVQVHEVFAYLGEYLPKLKVSHFIGGTDLISDRKRMNKCNIVIGTPGRLLHLHHKQVLCVSNLTLVVLDEADQLYQPHNMQRDALQQQVRTLIEALPVKVQKIACSATYENQLDEQLAKIMHKPVLISNSERATVLLGIRQFVYELPKQINNMAEMNCKLDAVAKIFKLVSYEQVVLFASSKMRADSFRNYLARRGVDCHLISGAMSQEERSKVFDCYRFFSMRTLVATDVFARGVDSPHTNLIVNLDPPKDHVDYLHRIGRAGRFGSKGIAITLVYEGLESDRFKGILCKAPTGKSVLEFPKAPERDMNFWDFQEYDFPYFIPEEHVQVVAEASKIDLKKEASKEKEVSTAVDASKIFKEALKDVLREMEASTAGDASKIKGAPKEEEASKDDLKKHVFKEEEASDVLKKKYAPKQEVASTAVDASPKKDAPKKEETSTDRNDPKVDNGAEKKAPPKKEYNPKVLTTNESVTCDPSIEPLVALPNANKPEISVVACPQLVETIQDALIEDKKETSDEELPEVSQKLENIESQGLKPTIDQNAAVLNNYNKAKDKPEQVSAKEKPCKDSNKEQPPPKITVNELQMESDQENQPNNNIINQNPEEFMSPELTPSSMTPLDLTSPTTLTPPAAPVNSINNKTYCLAAPTATSSMTLQAMVMSNTVDDASSISSDGSMGSRSESYSSIYTATDVQEIWNKFLINKTRLKRSSRNKNRRVIYTWTRSQGKRKYKKGKAKMYVNVCLLPEPKYYHLWDKMEYSQDILKRLLRYSKRNRLSNLELNFFLSQVYEAYDRTYGFKPEGQQPKKTKENKLTVHVTHKINIPAAAAGLAAVEGAAEDPDFDSNASEASQHSEEFSADEEEYVEEEEEQDSSSGFVESNESASSGIETSEYDTNTTADDDDDEYEDSDDESDSYDPMYDFDLTAEEIECEEEQEEDDGDDDEVINASLAGLSYQGSVSQSSDEESQPEDLDAEDSESELEESQSDNQLAAQAIYQQMFQTQYQFILSHVASHMARPQNGC